MTTIQLLYDRESLCFISVLRYAALSIITYEKQVDYSRQIRGALAEVMLGVREPSPDRTRVTRILVKYAGEERMGKVNSRAINQPGTQGGQVGLHDSIREWCCSLSLGMRPWERRERVREC